MFSKLFGSKKAEQEIQHKDISVDFSFLGTDIHSHYVPAIDDGAQTIEDSIALILAMKEMGFQNLVTTPHIKFDIYPNTPETINNGLLALQHALKDQNIVMPVKAAAEYFIDDQFMDLIEREPLLTVKDNEVLVELSFMFEPINLNDILFRIQMLGYRPILAHPERYAFYHQRPEMYEELRDRGCLLQLNTIALTGYYGKPVQKIAEMLLEKKLYDYCGSDMHHIRHAEALRKVSELKIFPALQQYPFRNKHIKFA